MGATLAIFVPSLNRPKSLKRLVENIRENTTVTHNMYFVISDDESAEILDDLGVNFWRDSGGTWIERNNFMYKHTKEPYIFLGSDDLDFKPDWDVIALKVMEEVDGVVPVNDMHNPNGTSAMVSRNYIDTMSGCVDTEGVIAYPGYHHNFADTELFRTAESRHRFKYATNSIVEHLHPSAEKSKTDDTYKRAESFITQDKELFNNRSNLW